MNAYHLFRSNLVCHLALVLCCGAVLLGCEQPAAIQPQSSARQEPASAPTVGTIERRALAKTVDPIIGEVVADFRHASEPAERREVAESERREIVSMVFGAGAPKDVWVADSASGAFTHPNTHQQLYLLTRGRPNASSPNVKPPMLVVMQDGVPVAQFVFADMAYQAITNTLDSNGDGIDEVLLTAHAYQMGQQVSATHLYSFAGATRKQLQAFKQVFENACDAAFSDHTVRASVLALDKSPTSDSALRRWDYIAPCQDDNAPPAHQQFALAESHAD